MPQSDVHNIPSSTFIFAVCTTPTQCNKFVMLISTTKVINVLFLRVFKMCFCTLYSTLIFTIILCCAILSCSVTVLSINRTFCKPLFVFNVVVVDVVVDAFSVVVAFNVVVVAVAVVVDVVVVSVVVIVF